MVSSEIVSNIPVKDVNRYVGGSKLKGVGRTNYWMVGLFVVCSIALLRAARRAMAVALLLLL